MSKATIEDFRLCLDEMMKKDGVENYEIHISGDKIKGEGYMGELSFVTVKPVGNKVPRKPYELVIKFAKKNDKLRQSSPIKQTYLREILLYDTVFPTFEQFQLEHSIQEPFKKYPKCYAVCKEEKRESVVLENLKLQGFEMHERTVTMNLDHIQFVLIQYARFHAISLAMKQIKPELFRSLTRDMDDVLIQFVVQANMVKSFAEYMKKSVGLLSASDAKKFEGYESEIEEHYTKITYDKEDPATVIVHGDCWNCNLLFKYDKTDKTKPIDVHFLDFQLSRVAHPILDISYFIYVCSDKEVLKNFDSLLELYHSTLSDSLSQYGVDINKLFTLTKLREDWKTIGKYGVYMALVVLQFALCKKTEVVDLEDAAEKDEGLVGSFITMMRNDKRYDDRARAILEHFAETFL